MPQRRARISRDWNGACWRCTNLRLKRRRWHVTRAMVFVDEDFRDTEGRYAADPHCGACNNDCAGAIPTARRLRFDRGSPHCVVQSCDDGYLRLTPFACSAPPALSCKPCATGDDCQGGACITIDTGTYCASPVSMPRRVCDGLRLSDAPGGGEGCWPLSGSCVCNAAGDGLERGCFSANAFGVCTGSETCAAATGWGAARQRPRSPRAATASTTTATAASMTALPPPSLRGELINTFGTCGGAWRCDGLNLWVCEAATPAAEVCNGLDDECDGQVTRSSVTRRPASTTRTCTAARVTRAVSDSSAHGTGKCQLVDSAARLCRRPRATPAIHNRWWPLVRPGRDAPLRRLHHRRRLSGRRDAADLDGFSVCGRDCAAGNDYGEPAGTCPTGFTCNDIGGAKSSASRQRFVRLPQANQGAARSCTVQSAVGTCAGASTATPPAVGRPATHDAGHRDLQRSRRRLRRRRRRRAIWATSAPPASSASASASEPVSGSAPRRAPPARPFARCRQVGPESRFATVSTTTATAPSTKGRSGPTSALSASSAPASASEPVSGFAPRRTPPARPFARCRQVRSESRIATVSTTTATASPTTDCRRALPQPDRRLYWLAPELRGRLGWLSCNALSYGANYEPVETSCDNRDNDCDGAIDERPIGAAVQPAERRLRRRPPELRRFERVAGL